LVCSAHKFYGPKGIGAVYLNPDLKIKPVPLIHGGGHEGGFRSGTLNVPAIVGMGVAAKICKEEMLKDATHIQILRDHFEIAILSALEKTFVNGNQNQRLHTVSNICVEHTDSQAVMSKFRTKMAISSGSACSSADPSPSHVLLAMGLSEQQARGSYRFSLGRMTTREEIETAVNLFIEAINEYREQSPVWAMVQKGVDVSGAL
jgi:cysteine desulfurase